MYDTGFLCTYQLIEDETDSDSMYQVQFLQAFNLDTWNDEQIGKDIDTLFGDMERLEVIQKGIAKVRDNEQLSQLLLLAGDSNETIFRFLFGYDVFHLTHRCICEFRNDGAISDATSEALLNKL